MGNAITSLVRRGLDHWSRQKYRTQTRSRIEELASQDDPRLRSIGAVLRRVVADEWSSDERALFDAIERRRQELLDSDEEIMVIDFGAGTSDSHRTQEEMERGTEKTAFVSDVADASKAAFWARLLYGLVRELRPVSCVELGTCAGISAAYQAGALRLNGNGRLTTLEGSPGTAAIAAETFSSLGLTNVSMVTGPFQRTFRDVLDACRPVDYLFNDGHHDHDSVLRYFNESYPHLSEGAVIVFDDIKWSEGMRRAWSEIETDGRVAASIDLLMIGIAIVKTGIAGKPACKIPLRRVMLEGRP